jgi:hypothetical protein
MLPLPLAFTSIDFARNEQSHFVRPLERDLALLLNDAFVCDGIYFAHATDAFPAVPIVGRLDSELIASIHSLAGHLGGSRLFRWLRAFIIAPHLSRDVTAVVAACDFCRRRVAPFSRVPKPGISEATGPFDWFLLVRPARRCPDQAPRR